MHSIFSAYKNISVIALTMFLVACGGGSNGTGNGNGSGTDTVNQAPVANAGSGQSTPEHTQVTLTGSATDSDGNIASYTWSQTSGPSVTIENSDSASAVFIAPDVTEDTALTFQLTATDNQGATGSSDVEITVTNVNQIPIADAGADQSQKAGTLVTLIGSGSDSDGSIAAYQWQQTVGPVVSLSSADSANTTFTMPEAATGTELTFQLTVTDNDNSTVIDEVTITLVGTIVIDAGLNSVQLVGSEIDLIGSVKDLAGNTIVAYQWQQTAGSLVAIENADKAQAQFIIPQLTQNEVLTFTLTVTDAFGQTVADSVSIHGAVKQLASELSFIDTSLTQCIDKHIATEGYEYIHQIKRIDCSLSNIRQLRGIEDLVFLEMFDFDTNAYSGDLSAFEALFNLHTLILAGNEFTDISPLASLSNLRVLDLGSRSYLLGWLVKNQISDLSALNNMPLLSELLLKDNVVSDINLLKQMPYLTKLDLSRNPINNLEILGQLTNLTEFRFDKTPVADYSPLASLTKLTTLSLAYAQLSDISFIAGMTELTSISLNANSITDISPLEGANKLQFADLSGNNIVDISPLAGAIDMDTLDLDSNYIVDIEGLTSLTSITYLYLVGNNIVDLTPIFGYTQLQRISLWGNNKLLCTSLYEANRLFGQDVISEPYTCQGSDDLLLSDIEFDLGLKACVTDQSAANDWTMVGDVVSLNCSNYKINNLQGLNYLAHLTKIDFSHNYINSFYYFKDLTHLSELNLEDNYVGRIEYLQDIDSLTKVDVRNNDMIHCGDLTQLEQALGQGVVQRSETCFEPQRIIEMEFPDSRMKTCVLTVANNSDLVYSDEVTSLYCASMGISNLEGIGQLPYVDNVVFPENKITDLSPLADIKGLKRFNFNTNKLTDINADTLAQLKLIKDVSFRTNNISEFVPPGNSQQYDLSHITSLDLTHNSISSLTGLERIDFSSLKELNITSSQLNDIRNLPLLTSLVVIDLYGNDIDDVTSLHPYRHIQQLDLSANNNIACTQLDEFEISENYPDLTYFLRPTNCIQ